MKNGLVIADSGSIFSLAKDKKIISELRPLFKVLLKNNRFYSITLLNSILEIHKEKRINYKAF